MRTGLVNCKGLAVIKDDVANSARCDINITFPGRDPHIGEDVTIYGGIFSDNIAIGARSQVGKGVEFGAGAAIGPDNCVEDNTKFNEMSRSSEANVAWRTVYGRTTPERAGYGSGFTYNLYTGKCDEGTAGTAHR